MNREERKTTIVGAIMVVLLIAAGAAIFFARNGSGDYTIITMWPSVVKLKKGDPVMIKGVIVGTVVKAAGNSPQAGTSVRMSVSADAFGAIGPDSTAWIDNSEPGRLKIIIQPGIPDRTGRFIKIKPVRAVDAPKENNTK